MSKCEHTEKIEVGGLKYCKKCNICFGEVRELNPLVKDFVEHFNRTLENAKN